MVIYTRSSEEFLFKYFSFHLWQNYYLGYFASSGEEEVYVYFLTLFACGEAIELESFSGSGEEKYVMFLVCALAYEIYLRQYLISKYFLYFILVKVVDYFQF